MDTSLIFEPQNLTKETIKKFLCPSASDQELMMGLQITKTFNLNPLKREVYFVKYGNNPMSVLTGYEVYLKRAERSQKWDGMEVGSTGSIKEGDLKAVVKIYKKDWANPLTHEVYYSEYVQTKADGSPNRFWATKPITMIKKVAVSQALRLAFSDEFDGMPYTSDEVVDQDKIFDIKLEQPTTGTWTSSSNNIKREVKEPSLEEHLHDTPQIIEPPKKDISAELQEVMDLGKKVFKGKRINFSRWVGTNFSTNELEKLTLEDLSKAKNILTDMIDNPKENENAAI